MPKAKRTSTSTRRAKSGPKRGAAATKKSAATKPREMPVPHALRESIRGLADVVTKMSAVLDPHLADIEAELWPRRRPASVQWATVSRRALDRIEQRAEELLRADVDLARANGMLWPNGSSIRNGTAYEYAKLRRFADAAAGRDDGRVLDEFVAGCSSRRKKRSFLALAMETSMMLESLPDGLRGLRLDKAGIEELRRTIPYVYDAYGGCLCLLMVVAEEALDSAAVQVITSGLAQLRTTIHDVGARAASLD